MFSAFLLGFLVKVLNFSLISAYISLITGFEEFPPSLTASTALVMDSRPVL